MQKYRPDISYTVERRAQEAATGLQGVVQPSAQVKAQPLRKALVKKKTQPSESAVLTSRERRVKDILVKELEEMYGSGGGLTYSEKQHLEKTLNVDFIECELEGMAKREQRLRLFTKLDLLFLALVTIMLVMGDNLEWGSILYPLMFVVQYIALKWERRSLRRRRFIYEALRELTDADEIDVTLDRVAREADALIEQIVERELDLDKRYPVRPFANA